MLSAKQGNYWYHFYNIFGMTRLNALKKDALVLEIGGLNSRSVLISRCLNSVTLL